VKEQMKKGISISFIFTIDYLHISDLILKLWDITDIFRIGPIPVSPITTRSESAGHFDNCKEKSQEILDWLINKGIIT
jgi:hypothetical protein